ncbi:MAG TPA: hypothetical protein EYQ81_14705 [Sneathiellales bacterium]|nr:hypothetical protein [Sneathiellales bacterium]
MTVETLDHFTIVTADLDTSVAFYTDVLGLENGKRPDLGFPGAWIYAGDKAVVHLLGSDGADMMAKGGITGGSPNEEDAGPQGTGSMPQGTGSPGGTGSMPPTPLTVIGIMG